MPGLFSGIEMAKRALIVHQMRLGVISHNIANAATPGYSRQEAILQTTEPYRQGRGFFGTGVTIAHVQRQRDFFFDQRALAERGQLGRFEAQHSSLQQVENVLANISDVGIGARLSEFWQSWNELANRPTDIAARTSVVSSTRALAASFRNAHSDLSDVRITIRAQIESTVGEVNRLATEVAALNRTIHEAEVTGQQANDLRDRRDLLVETLSELAGATSTEGADGQVTVRIGGRFLVDGAQTLAIDVDRAPTPDSAGGPALWADGLEINGLAGRLGGLIDGRDQTVLGVMADIDLLASTLIREVNALHDDGTGTFEVFTGSGAQDIEIGPSIAADLWAVRAGTGATGDNSIALALAEAEHQPLDSLGNITLDGYLSVLVGEIGSRVREAQDLTESQQLVMLQVENVRQSISGVSLDEEAAELVMAQRSFQAAAQVVETLDSMLETVIFSIAG